jgi:succinate dehydrogenase / fumarate reductase cytochrome b subunit
MTKRTKGKAVTAQVVATLFDKSSDLNPRNMRLGMYAWIIQRVSGLYLVFFLLTHITAIAQASFGISTGFQANVFDVLRNPFYMGGTTAVVFNLVALGIIAFHGLNGIRIVMLDLGVGVRKYRNGFWISMIVAIAASACVIFLALPLLAGG